MTLLTVVNTFYRHKTLLRITLNWMAKHAVLPHSVRLKKIWQTLNDRTYQTYRRNKTNTRLYWPGLRCISTGYSTCRVPIVGMLFPDLCQHSGSCCCCVVSVNLGIFLASLTGAGRFVSVRCLQHFKDRGFLTPPP